MPTTTQSTALRTDKPCRPQTASRALAKGFAHSPARSFFHKPKNHTAHCTPEHREAQQTLENPVLLPNSSFSHSAGSVLPSAEKRGISWGWQKSSRNSIIYKGNLLITLRG